MIADLIADSIEKSVLYVCDDLITDPAITCQTSAVQTRSDFLTDAKRHFIKITNLTKKAKGSQYEDDICRTESVPSLEIFNIQLKIFSIEYENSTVLERGFSLQSINFNEPEISKKYYFLLHKGYFTHF